MTPEEIKLIVEKTLNGSIRYYWRYLIASFLVGILLTIGVEFLKTKGQNLATKQDIEQITKQVEQVKAEVQKGQEIEKQKRELKYKALLSSLDIMDAYISNFIISSETSKVVKQYASIEDVRKCFNSLILSCNNPEIIELFIKIQVKPKDKTAKGTQQVLDDLVKYRTLVRKELEFGSEIKYDMNYIWLASAPYDNGTNAQH